MVPTITISPRAFLTSTGLYIFASLWVSSRCRPPPEGGREVDLRLAPSAIARELGRARLSEEDLGGELNLDGGV